MLNMKELMKLMDFIFFIGMNGNLILKKGI